MSVEFRDVVKRYGTATAVAGVSFMVKARVTFYPTGSSLIQEERYYAEFARRADATAFCLKWTG